MQELEQEERLNREEIEPSGDETVLSQDNFLDVFLGAWMAGLGFILVMLGLSVWVKATCHLVPTLKESK